jgi:hypothetical protein
MTLLQMILAAPFAGMLLLALIGSFLLVKHRGRYPLNAGTVPNNFPAENIPPIGAIFTGNSLGNTAALASTVFFTAPISGLYLVSMALQVTATNNAGSVAATLTTPHAGTVAQSLSPSSSGTAQTAIERDMALGSGTGQDGFSAAIPVWMNVGQQISVACTVSGLTGSTYNVFVVAQRAF